MWAPRGESGGGLQRSWAEIGGRVKRENHLFTFGFVEFHAPTDICLLD